VHADITAVASGNGGFRQDLRRRHGEGMNLVLMTGRLVRAAY
jgi:hypothetical protein